MSSDTKEYAIALRKEGLSYREILLKVRVAKSTLSLWLREVGLSRTQRQKLTEKKLQGIRRGAAARRLQKEELMFRLITKARKQPGKLSQREFWLVGTALYWAEGSKEKPHNSGVGLIFNNSDPSMITFYVRWLRQVLKVPSIDIRCTLYIHQTKTKELARVVDFWTRLLGLPADGIRGIYFKRSAVRTQRKNTGALYYGTMRVTVARSSSLNRKVAGWIQGIAESK